MRFNIRVSALLALGVVCISLQAQYPCKKGKSPIVTNTKKAFEIVSILVDACDGNNEGENEMLQLITGYQPLKVNAFSVANYKSGRVNWGSSSNPFRGFANKSNALNQKINSINQQIKQSRNCGHFILLTPNDIIPPHSKVLIITSTDFNPSAHDFSPLVDTLFVLVQKPGNTAGHFVNHGTSDTRTLILQHGSQADTVTYNRSKLKKQNGTEGPEDGAVVNFSQTGTPLYANNGCKIPITEPSLSAGKTILLDCDASFVSLNGKIEGFPCFYWKANPPNSGKFNDSTLPNPRFSLSSNKPDSIVFTLTAYSFCGGSLSDKITVKFPQAPTARLSTDTLNGLQCFENFSDGANYYEWQWRSQASPKDSLWGSTNRNEKPCFPIDTFAHTLCLNAINTQNGCRDSVCISWKNKPLQKEHYLQLANVFTPGTDGFNDELYVIHKGLKQLKWRIYDRSGSEVFSTNSSDEPWNGRVYNTGLECSAGVYFALISYQLEGESEQTLSQTITLIR
jgi:gliding motility-associated-like protein